MANADCDELCVGNTIAVWIEGVFDDDGEPITTAIGSFSLKTAAGVAIDGYQNIAMSYVSDGEYKGILPSAAPLVAGTSYMVHSVLTVDGVGVGDWRPIRKARYR